MSVEKYARKLSRVILSLIMNTHQKGFTPNKSAKHIFHSIEVMGIDNLAATVFHSWLAKLVFPSQVRPQWNLSHLSYQVEK